MRLFVLSCLASLGALLLAADPAEAQSGTCPTAETTSFVLTRDQPFTKVEVERDGPQSVAKTTAVADGVTTLVQTRFERGLLPVIRADQSGLIQQRFGPIPDEFWNFTVGQEVTVPITVDMRGQQEFAGTHTIKVQSVRTLAVGDCEYAVAMIVQDTDLGFTRLLFRQAYSPRLGYILAAQQIDPESGKALPGLSYDRIEAK